MLRDSDGHLLCSSMNLVQLPLSEEALMLKSASLGL